MLPMPSVSGTHFSSDKRSLPHRPPPCDVNTNSKRGDSTCRIRHTQRAPFPQPFESELLVRFRCSLEVHSLSVHGSRPRPHPTRRAWHELVRGSECCIAAYGQGHPSQLLTDMLFALPF